jgi:hypothetical protein
MLNGKKMGGDPWLVFVVPAGNNHSVYDGFVHYLSKDYDFEYAESASGLAKVEAYVMEFDEHSWSTS